MAWTDERVDLLKKLWSEGLSASQIANRLGGVTRNAVIGKVHRLGLSGRATTSRVKSVKTRKNTAKSPNRVIKPKFINVAQAALKKGLDEKALSKNENVSHALEELFIPPEERASITSLKENSCRWPIGDPTDDDFHFCGRKKVPGTPYCEFHCQVAFQPAQTRRRKKDFKQLAG
ncbi:MAG: GcrA family cell cycle regulator [Pseudomonadota bacterium]